MIYLITFAFVYLAVLITYWIATEWPEPLRISAGDPVMVVEWPDPASVDRIEVIAKKGGFDIR